MSKRVFIVWARYHRRSELLAQHFGATIHYVYYGKVGKLWQAPVRYLIEAWQTWRILRRERPDIIFVQNPPIFAVVVVFLYARCHGARYVIDSHTGAFLGPKWGWSVGLHRRLSRGALTTIVHNTDIEKVVSSWGCRSLVIAFVPGEYPIALPAALDGKFNVAVVGSFGADEPVDIVFEAASRLREVGFYLTGDFNRLAPSLLAKAPDNCHLTGYLRYEQYVGLLREVDAIMVLTTRDSTLLMGGFEAVSLGIPLIISDWPVLRDYFYLGAVHIPNTALGVYEGVRRVQSELADLRPGVLELRTQLEAEWEQKFAELQNLLGGS